MFEDKLRDNLILQQDTLTDDSGGGQDSSWDGVLRLKCRLRQLSGKEVFEAYERQTGELVYRAYFSDRIPTTDGSRSLHELLRKSGETAFRFLWEGNRTLTPIGLHMPAAGTSDHFMGIMWMDCVEAPQGVGFADL
jgi:hypothetical protein